MHNVSPVISPKALPRRILIIDSHEIIFNGLAQLLSSGLPGTVAEWGSSLQALPPLLADNQWALILTDLVIDRQSLLELRELHDACKNTPTLLFSGKDPAEMAASAARLGASGYINKGAEKLVLLAAIKKVLMGGSYLPHPTTSSFDLPKSTSNDATPPSQLSQRDQLLLQLLMNGKPLKEIATCLSVSQKTVGTYRTRVFAQIGASNMAEAMRYCIKHQFSLLPAKAPVEVNIKAA